MVFGGCWCGESVHWAGGWPVVCAATCSWLPPALQACVSSCSSPRFCDLPRIPSLGQLWVVRLALSCVSDLVHGTCRV